jgi:hypothetical protein
MLDALARHRLGRGLLRTAHRLGVARDRIDGALNAELLDGLPAARSMRQELSSLIASVERRRT